MARVSKKKEVECENNASAGRKTRQKEIQKCLSRQKTINSLSQATISHFFRSLEVDTKKTQIASSARTSRVANSNLSSKGKVASRKYKPKKSKAKQLEEIQKYNKKIPMFFGYINPEKAKENGFENNRGKTQTKSIRTSKKNSDELLKNQRQLTEFYDLSEQISELSLSNESELSRNNDDGTVIRRADSNLEDDNILESSLNEKEKGKNREIPEISKSVKIINRNSINFDNVMDYNSPLITSSRFNLQYSPPDTLSYHLSNFSIEPNDSFITMSPKVVSNTTINRHLELEVGKTPTKTRMVSTDVENDGLNNTMQDNSSQRNYLNPDDESLCGNVTKRRRSNVSSHLSYGDNVTDQVGYNNLSNFVEESRVEESSYNILPCHVDESHCNNVTNENVYNLEMSLIEIENENIIREITDAEDKMIIGDEVNDGVIDRERSKCNDFVIENDSHSDNCEIVNENFHNKVHPKDKNQDDKSHCYSWEDEIINFHNESFLEIEDHKMQKINMNEDTSFMIRKELLEKEDSNIQGADLNENMSRLIQREQTENKDYTKKKAHVNENISCMIQELSGKNGQGTNLNEDSSYTIDNQSPIDFHCCSQSENKCKFHYIYDLLDKENYNPDSSTFELLNDPIPKELNDISNQREQIDTRQDRLPPTEYIRSSARFLRDEVSPAPSPPSLLSQTTLAMIPQSAWDTLPSLNISTLDSEELNGDLL